MKMTKMTALLLAAAMALTACGSTAAVSSESAASAAAAPEVTASPEEAAVAPAAAPAVTAVGAARRHEFFAVERHRTVAALAGVQPDRGGINKITGCHVVPHLQKITKNERAAKARPYRFFYCLTVQRLRSRPMRSK